MHLEYFKLFNDIVTARSISKVAISSHISQPALSQQIQKLEDSLENKLLERSNKGVELTDAGLVVAKYSKDIIKIYENMLEDLKSIKSFNTTIRIAATPPVANYILPGAIYKLRDLFPDNNYDLHSVHSYEVERNVINNICDVGFVHGEPTDTGLNSTKVGQDKIVAVASQNFRIPDNLTCDDFKKYPMIMLRDECKTRKELNKYFSELGHEPKDFNILLNLGSTESIKYSVIEGYGFSFLPYVSVKKELHTKQLKEINVQDFNMRYDIYFIYVQQEGMSRSVKDFIHYIKVNGERTFNHI